MTEKIIIAGAGGQGVMLLGKVLAEIAMRENKPVTWLPAYGAEVRGGTAHCMVVISDEEVGSPYIAKADTLMMMNEPSWMKFQARVKNNGLLILNRSLINKKVRKHSGVLYLPFTDLAVQLGNIKVANMVMLGVYIAKRKTVALKNALQVIEEIAPKEKKGLVKINQEAILLGANLIKC